MRRWKRLARKLSAVSFQPEQADVVEPFLHGWQMIESRWVLRLSPN